MKNLQPDKIRKKLRLTQPELAEILEITRGRLAMVESGKRPLPYEAYAILAALNNAQQNASRSSGILARLKKSPEFFEDITVMLRKATLQLANTKKLLDTTTKRFIGLSHGIEALEKTTKRSAPKQPPAVAGRASQRLFKMNNKALQCGALIERLEFDIEFLGSNIKFYENYLRKSNR